MNFDTAHGCACGQKGDRVASRPIGDKPTRHREVDVQHQDGAVHTNVIRFGEPMTREDGTRWIPLNKRKPLAS